MEDPTDVVDVLGRFGLYHGIVLLVAVLRAFPTAWTYMMTPMMAPDVDHWCAPPSSLSSSIEPAVWKSLAIPTLNGKLSKCSMYDLDIDALISTQNWTKLAFDGVQSAGVPIVPCKFGWSYNETGFGRTVISEWTLVCDDAWKASAMQSVVMAGSLCGVLLFGKVSDAYGRKRSFYICTSLVLVLGSAVALAPSITLFNIGRFLVAVAVAGIQASAVTLFIEVMPAGDRAWMSVGFGVGFTIPLLFVPLLAWYLQDFRWMQLAAGLSALLLVPFYPVLQESPKWLLAKGYAYRAEQAIVRILRLNRRPMPNVTEVVPRLLRAARANATSDKENKLGFFEMMRIPALRRNTLCLVVVWSSTSFMYFYLSLNAGRDPGNPYINFALSSTSEIPAAFVGLYVSRRVGRKPSQIIPMLLGTVVFIAVQLLCPEDAHWYKVTGNMVVRFLVLSAIFVMWIAVLEVFPTPARSIGFACGLVSSRFGAMLAPFGRDLAERLHPSLPYVLFAVAGFGSALGNCGLPETLNRPLPDTIEEVEALSSQKASGSIPLRTSIK